MIIWTATPTGCIYRYVHLSLQHRCNGLGKQLNRLPVQHRKMGWKLKFKILAIILEVVTYR